jgi:hypothetical protein
MHLLRRSNEQQQSRRPECLGFKREGSAVKRPRYFKCRLSESSCSEEEDSNQKKLACEIKAEIDRQLNQIMESTSQSSVGAPAADLESDTEKEAQNKHQAEHANEEDDELDETVY